ncbi:hypothetical protein HanPI659440_Chr16g0654821 [Helianthus annuus]|nr:hypothetical protein HanPI659440_Chr16g0654821 [Helianthus annuus]
MWLWFNRPLAVSGDKGKGTGSSRAKDSGSKVILYGSEHLFVEDEGVDADGGEDDAEVRPQVSFKRGQSTSAKPDPNPKGPKKTKLALKSIVLEDDADRVIDFSAAGGLLDNLDAHLHGGKTPRDQPFVLPTSPISFGGLTTKVIADTEMLDPLAFKKIDLSPSGKPTTGVASNVSRPSPQQTDRWWGQRWVEAESNCRRYEREVASLKNEENIRSKTKQELSSLRAQVDRLKEQVSEAKEINKASQASTAAAYEARDKAVQDLEGLKLKFEALEKKLFEVEEENKKEQKKMQSSYDQLLADHLRTVNGTFIAELERARDKAVESHQTTVADMKDTLSRYDGEMVELYGLTSELLLTKQWFLTEGVDWVVKLVHQSPELEKVVADLVNSVNAVGVNEDIKQGFQAAKSSAKTASEVLAYDEGAKDALDVAIKAFDNFHISVLDKVTELVNEPLSVIKEKKQASHCQGRLMDMVLCSRTVFCFVFNYGM